jgi:hypothetical protein
VKKVEWRWKGWWKKPDFLDYMYENRGDGNLGTGNAKEFN